MAIVNLQVQAADALTLSDSLKLSTNPVVKPTTTYVYLTIGCNSEKDPDAFLARLNDLGSQGYLYLDTIYGYPSVIHLLVKTN